MEARQHPKAAAGEAACTEALAAGLCTSAIILNLLARQSQPVAAEAVATPESLVLAMPPVAYCARYDILLTGAHHGTA